MFTKTTAASLGNRKTRILGVFTKAQEELTDLMNSQAAYNSSLVDKIQELEAERSEVEKESHNTRRLLRKISEFLN